MSSSHNNNKAVDEAFQRLFGYAWGTELPTMDDNDDDLPNDLIQVFGSKHKVAQILRLPSMKRNHNGTDVGNNQIDAARLLTRRIVTIKGDERLQQSTPIPATVASFKRRRLNDDDWKNIQLPETVVANLKEAAAAKPTGASSAAAAATSSATSKLAAAAAATAKSDAARPSSKLDSVLQQLAGTKKPNTVEKTNTDWESFKEQDKTLQDDLERTAQSKDAFLVKQDFIHRVDQRKFELEKSERDQERARRGGGSSSKK